MHRQSVSASPFGGLRFRAAPWWLAALGAADGAAATISAAEPPRGDAFERTKPSSSARSRHRLRPS
jgi:hypothetical protein